MGRPSQVRLLRHPPERGRSGFLLYCGPHCSCCCCCCLHTLGGLTGALISTVAQAKSRKPPPLLRIPAAGPPPVRGSPAGRASRVYWFCLALVVATASLVSVGLLDEKPEEVAFVGAMILPALQLVAAILALLILAIPPAHAFPEKKASLIALGKITLWTVIGTILGVVAMLMLAGLVSALT